LSDSVGFFEKSGNKPDQELKNNEVVISSKDPVIKKYLPFYSVDIQNLRSSFVGQYGHDRWEPYTTWVYNPALKMSLPQTHYRLVTDWYDCQGEVGPIDRPFGIKKTQIYGGFEYPKEHVEEIMQTARVTEITDLEIDKNTTISPHEMKINYAVEKMNSVLFEMEETRIKHYIAQHWNADRGRVHSLTMKLHEADVNIKLYNMPAYIYNYQIGGSDLHKIVNGFNGQLRGNSVSDPLKLGITAGLFVGSFGLMAFGPVAGVAAGVARFLIPAAVGGGLFGWVSSHDGETEKYKNEQSINTEKKKNEAYCNDSEEYLNQKNQYNTDHKQIAVVVKSERLDMLRLLGLTEHIELTSQVLKKHYYQEIKKWHLDSYNGDDVQFAKSMARQINNAYEILKKECN